jgi:hypothetical protein
MAFRFASESMSAPAFPPLAPPSFPIATAAGFLAGLAVQARLADHVREIDELVSLIV